MALSSENEPSEEIKHSPTIDQPSNEKPDQENPPESVESKSIKKDPNDNSTNQKNGNKYQWMHLLIQFLLFLATTGAFFAALHYADIANKQRVIMQEQWKTMDATFQEIEQQTGSVKESADAAKRAADTAEKTLSAAQRPWISIRLSIGGGLTFDNNGARLPVLFKIKNIGKSPALATSIIPHTKIVLGFGPNNAIAERKKMLTSAEKYFRESVHALGYMLFPDEEVVQLITFGINQDFIRQSQKEISSRFDGLKPTDINYIWPHIVGYVRYGSLFDKFIHKTAFMVEVCQIDPLHPDGCSIIVPANGNIPANMLKLQTSDLGSYAD